MVVVFKDNCNTETKKNSTLVFRGGIMPWVPWIALLRLLLTKDLVISGPRSSRHPRYVLLKPLTAKHLVSTTHGTAEDETSLLFRDVLVRPI